MALTQSSGKERAKFSSHQYCCEDLSKDLGLNDLVEYASEVFGTPIAFVSLVSGEGEKRPVRVGIEVDTVDIKDSFCAHTGAQDEIFEVFDTYDDERFYDNISVVEEPFIRFYAGVPLKSAEGDAVGAFCVLDQKPRRLSKSQRRVLKMLASQAEGRLDLLRKVHQLEAERERAASEKVLRKMSEDLLQMVSKNLPVRIFYLSKDLRFQYINDTFEHQLNIKRENVIGRTVSEVMGAENFSLVKSTYENVLVGHSQVVEVNFGHPYPNQWLRTNYHPIYDSHGEVDGIVGHVLDITAEKSAAKILLDERARLEQILFQAQVATFDWDLVEDRVKGNALLDEFFGIKSNSTGCDPIQTYLEALNPADLVSAHAAIESSISTGCSYETQYRATGESGLERTLFSRGDVTVSNEGRPLRLSGIVFDISSKVALDRALHERAELFKKAFEQAADDAIIVLSADRVITEWNPTAQRLFGWSPEEAIGKPIDVIFTPQDIEHGIVAIEAEMAANTGSCSSDRWHMRRDGSKFWANGTVSIIDEADGTVLGYLLVFRDATSRREAEKTLKLLSTIGEEVGALTDPTEIARAYSEQIGQFLTTDFALYISFIDDFKEVVFEGGWTSNGSLLKEGQRPLTAFSRSILPKLLKGKTVNIDVKEDLQPFEGFDCRTPGRPIKSALFCPVMRNQELVSAFSVFSETRRSWTEEEAALVSQVAERAWTSVERARAVQQLLEANTALDARVAERTRELVEAVKEAEGFNYSISHDLRAPVRAIVSTSRILLEEATDKLSPEHKTFLERQAFNANRLGTLIDELLRLSRLARAAVNRKAIDMSAMALSIACEIEAIPNINIQDGMTGQGDPGLVRTVLENLIENACKFSPNGTPVFVGEDNGVFWVRDMGIGFDMAYVHKIFLPFERLVTEAEFQGTGIGLANVERIVRRHGGRIWAEGEKGVGSTFYFTLSNDVQLAA